MTVADMKIGDRLIFGEYDVIPSEFEPITWLKATRGNIFLSEYALDYIPYDSKEPVNTDYYKRIYGSSDYRTSNIFQFMNSDEEDWFFPAHEFDAAPGTDGHSMDSRGMYRRHPGFLYGFEEYEIASLKSSINLPRVDDILGGSRFELFNRKGTRARGTDGLIYRRCGHGFQETSYIDFWTRSVKDACSIRIVDRSGYANTRLASGCSGLRPICTIDQSAKVEYDEPLKGYRLVPFEVSQPRNEACSMDELKAFLGLL